MQVYASAQATRWGERPGVRTPYLASTTTDLKAKGVEFTQEVTEERWGRLTRFQLPGGGEVGMYEPRHPLAIDL